MSKRKLNGTLKHCRKKVHFPCENDLETIYYVERVHVDGEGDNEDEDRALTRSDSTAVTSRMTDEIKIISSLHGKARRHLREIPKRDLQAAIKYGIKTRGFRCRSTGDQRWKSTYGNVVYITDNTCSREVTSYKESVSIQPCSITPEISQRHKEIQLILKENPRLCTSHTFVVLDQSGSMRTSDVNGFRNRSQAAYGSLALDYVATQLYEQPPGAVDTLTLIEMNDVGTTQFNREPLDWILFNKLLDRQSAAKPRSHGDYANSLMLAQNLITNELATLGDDIEHDDKPVITLVILSDGKPSDKEPHKVLLRTSIIEQLAKDLKDKFVLCCMGLGAKDSDFSQLQSFVVSASNNSAGKAEFLHAGLSALELGRGFSSLSESVTTLRTSTRNEEEGGSDDKDETDVEREVVRLRDRESFSRSRNQTMRKVGNVTRYKFNSNKWEKFTYEWDKVPMLNRTAVGFEVDKIPFGRGAERLAFRFQEIDTNGSLLGNVMVGKESKHQRWNEQRKMRLHSIMCRTQQKASELAKAYSRAIYGTPALQPVESFQKVPTIRFINCSVYTFIKANNDEAGLLVEPFLKGKWKKYNDNNGYVRRPDHRSIELRGVGEVALSDFLQAFSHWTYVHTDQKLLVCDLQGVLDEEGLKPNFKLTDPVICSRNSRAYRYGSTDIGNQGFKLFRCSHVCNGVCKGLGLPTFGIRRKNA